LGLLQSGNAAPDAGWTSARRAWRDTRGFSPTHQWLANRGYAVLSVNYRGSTGFGKAFVTAADHECGGSMRDDLIDALDWAVTNGIAEPKRVGFYGGYSALMAATKTLCRRRLEHDDPGKLRQRAVGKFSAPG
jgi:dipeptidyl aminopeptidase/acylaminoacyl peptidase